MFRETFHPKKINNNNSLINCCVIVIKFSLFCLDFIIIFIKTDLTLAWAFNTFEQMCCFGS